MATSPVVGTIPARVSLYTKRIRLLVQSCPKMPGSKAAARWALYANGMSVGQFLSLAKAAGHTHPASDIQYNIRHGFIALVDHVESRAQRLAAKASARAAAKSTT